MCLKLKTRMICSQLQTIRGFFVYMTIFVYNRNNRKETVIELPQLNLKFRFFNGLKLGILGTRHTCQSSSSLSW